MIDVCDIPALPENVVQYAELYLSPANPVKGSPFKVGDKVRFTNEYGVQFDEVVIGFDPDGHQAYPNGRYIHLWCVGAAYWFGHKDHELEIL